MRPGSRGNLGSSAGYPPGTGMNRPGSGRRAPGTARLRTGATPSGAGTEAAQGLAISANVNISDRPVTGQGMKGMKAKNSGTGRIVQDTAYFIGLLRKKINDVNKETIRLNDEIKQMSRDNSQFKQLENRHERLLKEKENLEGKLADCNLALDKTRTSTDPEDVLDMAAHMAEKNRQANQDLDRILMQRKQREMETQQVEDQIENHYLEIQKRINELEPGKLRAYNELLARQREFQDRFLHCENRLNEVNAMIHHYESDDKTNSLRKEYLALEKTYLASKKEADSLQEELDIANMDPKEAHQKFSARVNNFKTGAKTLEDRASLLREEINMAKRTLKELENSATQEDDPQEMQKYELLVKRDQDMTAFIDNFEETRAGVLREIQDVQFVVVALLEDISKGLEDSANMPSKEEHGELEDAKVFKEKNLATAQRTMDGLIAEKRKREKELELLRSSEPKLMSEMSGLREAMARMRSEMEQFQDLDRIRKDFESTKDRLLELKQTYSKRRDAMRQQIQSVSVEYESLKKSLASNEIAKEMDETEKRLKQNERMIFEVKEFVDSKTRETDYEMVRAACLKLVNQVNSTNIRNSQQIGMGGAQSKY